MLKSISDDDLQYLKRTQASRKQAYDNLNEARERLKQIEKQIETLEGLALRHDGAYASFSQYLSECYGFDLQQGEGVNANGVVILSNGKPKEFPDKDPVPVNALEADEVLGCCEDPANCTDCGVTEAAQ